MLLRNIDVFERSQRLGLTYMFLGIEALDETGLELYPKRVSPDAPGQPASSFIDRSPRPPALVGQAASAACCERIHLAELRRLEGRRDTPAAAGGGTGGMFVGGPGRHEDRLDRVRP